MTFLSQAQSCSGEKGVWGVGGNLRHAWDLTVAMWAPLQVLALCHIAVGQQMSLHWLHKVRAPPRGQTERSQAHHPWVRIRTVPVAHTVCSPCAQRCVHSLACAHSFNPRRSPVM